MFANLICDNGKESSRSCSRIENLNLMSFFSFVLYESVVCKTILYIQLCAKDGVNSINYEAYYFLWSVPHTKLLANLWIVFRKELLVEMHQWVFSIVAHNAFHIRNLEYLNQLFHNPFYATMQFCQGQLFENLFEERIDTWYKFRCLLQSECRRRFIIDASYEQTIDNRLCIKVGKLLFAHIMNKELFEGVQLHMQFVVFV